MNEKYIFIGVTDDYGKLQDGKPWQGKRVVAQYIRGDGAQTVILKAHKDLGIPDGFKAGDAFVPYFDRNGRVIGLSHK